MIFENGDKIALVALSNLNNFYEYESLKKLIKILESYNLEVIVGESVENIDLSNKTKANEVNRFFSDNVKAIFDISGGDRSNSILRYLDFSLIKKSSTLFFGLSDLTVILNSIYKKTGKVTGHFMLKNVFSQREEFYKEFFLGGNYLSTFDYKFLKGNRLNGLVVGGNIRCLLKLAGTEYMPCFDKKVLLLESLGGDKDQITSMLNHLYYLGVFDRVEGLILGKFTTLYKKLGVEGVERFFNEYFEEFNLPIVITDKLGHGRDKKLIYIGKEIDLI